MFWYFIPSSCPKIIFQSFFLCTTSALSGFKTLGLQNGQLSRLTFQIWSTPLLNIHFDNYESLSNEQIHLSHQTTPSTAWLSWSLLSLSLDQYSLSAHLQCSIFNSLVFHIDECTQARDWSSLALLYGPSRKFYVKTIYTLPKPTNSVRKELFSNSSMLESTLNNDHKPKVSFAILKYSLFIACCYFFTESYLLKHCYNQNPSQVSFHWYFAAQLFDFHISLCIPLQ